MNVFEISLVVFVGLPNKSNLSKIVRHDRMRHITLGNMELPPAHLPSPALHQVHAGQVEQLMRQVLL